MSSKKSTLDIFKLYIDSVQSPEVDLEFIERVFKDLRKKSPVTIREDFCGTFVLAKTWVEKNKKNKAIAVDLDPKPLRYGKEHFFDPMTDDQKKRLQVFQKDVRDPKLPKSDVVTVLNFSYFLFKKRQELVDYFSRVRKKLNASGVFLMDVFGGMACGEPNEEHTKFRKHTYFWDQKTFNPITNEAKFAIHLKPKGKKKKKNVFTYDWRFWSIPELREILEDAGFKQTYVYWEGSPRKSLGGNGVFRRTEKGEPCEAWIAYVVALK